MEHVHFIGIGGTGLSAIAFVLLDRGYKVTGSDLTESIYTKMLETRGAQVYIGHAASHVDGADCVIRSSAIPDSNIEVRTALDRGIKLFKRNEFLPEILNNKRVIAVAGSHGKTTTTALIAWILTCLGKDPSYIIGSSTKNLSMNGHHGDGEYFVIEADEYDHMFLGIHPDIAVLTNIDHDHPDLFPTKADYLKAFNQFAQNIKSEGIVIANSDDDNVRDLLKELNFPETRIKYFGTNLEFTPDYFIGQKFLEEDGSTTFIPGANNRPFIDDKIQLQIPGDHNMLNALAALVVMEQLGLNLQKASQAITTFAGVERRFDVRGEFGGILIIDDYAHHPSEIQAVLSTTRDKYPTRRVLAIWEPHTFSRSRKFLQDFARSFSSADSVFVMDVFPAREKTPSNGFNSEMISKMIDHESVIYSGNLNSTLEKLVEYSKPNDAIVIMSAGSAVKIGDMFSRIIENDN